jgi:hypothetical protein
MSQDPTSIENQLRQVRAATLDDSLLARLEACAGGTWTQLDSGEISIEQHLRKQAPARLSPDFMVRLESTLNEVPFPKSPTSENIVDFPKSEAQDTRTGHRWWPAAAAVAIVGALSALFIPENQRTGQLANSDQPKKPEITRPITSSGGDLVTAGFNRGISEARDEGVIWQANQKPHRVLKVVYRDQITLKDPNGKIYQAEQPKVEYILVPADTN